MNKFSVDKYKFGDKNINNRVNMEDIRIYPHDSPFASDFVNKLQLIESANSASPTETFKNTHKIIDNVIIRFDFDEGDSIDKIADFANPKYCYLRSKENLLNLF